MRQYETAFLISPKLEEEEIEKTIQEMADIVSQKKGKMIKQDKWGKKKLAYPIMKHDEAYYVFFTYEGDAEVSSELERRFKQTDKIIRYLTLRKSEKENIRKKGKKSRAPRKRTPSGENRPVKAETKETAAPETASEEEKE